MHFSTKKRRAGMSTHIAAMRLRVPQASKQNNIANRPAG
jgi:hypothetical protein